MDEAECELHTDCRGGGRYGYGTGGPQQINTLVSDHLHACLRDDDSLLVGEHLQEVVTRKSS